MSIFVYMVQYDHEAIAQLARELILMDHACVPFQV